MAETGRSAEHVSGEISCLNEVVVVSSIERKLYHDSPSFPENCIFKVPRTLRRHNEDVFKPNIVSIGPFHHGKDKLEATEKIKLWYLHCLLNRYTALWPPEKTLKSFVEGIGELQKLARQYYAEPINFCDNEFVEMMVVDGCFLIELFRKDAWLVPRHEDDPIFNSPYMLENLYHDLILLENQIPWFVLQRLFELTLSSHEEETHFHVRLVLSFFQTRMLMSVPAEYKPTEGHEIKHILDLLHSCLLPLHDSIEPKATEGGDKNARGGLCSIISRKKKMETPKNTWVLFPPVMDLLQAGVEFKEGNSDDILNIKFNNGVLEIPRIKIRGNSESLFRNLIAYEQCYRHCNDRFTSYAGFFDCLINSCKDAEVLCDKKKIIEHQLSTEDISLLFRRLYNDTRVNSYHYGDVSRKVNAYCRSRRHRWEATFKREYWKNPWRISSFIGGILILLFTFSQTVIAILAYLNVIPFRN